MPHVPDATGSSGSDETPPLVANAGARQQVERADRREKRIEQRTKLAWANVARTDDGKRVLLDLLGYCGLYRSPMGSDANWTHVHIGQGDVGRRILVRLHEADVGLYTELQAFKVKQERNDHG